MEGNYQDWKKALFSVQKNGFDRGAEKHLEAMHEYCEGYKAFLDVAKTEREAVSELVKQAEAAGFVPYQRGMSLKAGDKLYQINRGKALILCIIGQESLEKGIQMTAAHLDAPRLDLKPNPLYEEAELAYLKTHYYGGIRKYQWVTIPLELHGVIALKDGTVVPVSIGNAPNDPKLVITDLLPHLGMEQNKRPLGEAIPAENLNLLVGSRPVNGEGSERVKLAIMVWLHEKYGITEDDFTSAELEVVPAGSACDIGLDRSMIGAYGQDDRVCSYASFRALLDLTEIPQKTALCMLADKEEIGSDGVTGMQSAMFDAFVEDLCDSQQVALRHCFANSFCLSSDVTAAYDPNFSEVFEKRNAARLNYGVGLCKYTGARGKAGASDADAETVAYVRGLLDSKEILWQLSELGKVDAGGGGTVAMYMANRNINTLDAGVPVLSMHAPFEVVSKLDCFETYRAMMAVYQG